MSVLTQAIYNALASDVTLTGLLNTYGGKPAIFTTDPAPGDAAMPYVITAGNVAQEAWDTKTTRGRIATRDIRCYTTESGSAETVEAIAERVRELLHRREIAIDGYDWTMCECSGPAAADEQDAYGRIVTVRMTVQER